MTVCMMLVVLCINVCMMIVLLDVGSFRMRIEGLLIKEEFNSNMEWIRPSIEAVIQAAKGKHCTINSCMYSA